jgi:hypothetical protein
VIASGFWSPNDHGTKHKFVPAPPEGREPRLVRVVEIVRHHALKGSWRELVVYGTESLGAQKGEHNVLSRRMPAWARDILTALAKAAGDEGATVLLSWEGSAGSYAFWTLPPGVRTAAEWQSATDATIRRREEAAQQKRRAHADAWAANINAALAQAAGPDGLWEGVTAEWLLSQPELWYAYGSTAPDGATAGTAIRADGTTYTVVLSKSLLRPNGTPNWLPHQMVRRVDS